MLNPFRIVRELKNLRTQVAYLKEHKVQLQHNLELSEDYKDAMLVKLIGNIKEKIVLLRDKRKAESELEKTIELLEDECQENENLQTQMECMAQHIKSLQSEYEAEIGRNNRFDMRLVPELMEMPERSCHTEVRLPVVAEIILSEDSQQPPNESHVLIKIESNDGSNHDMRFAYCMTKEATPEAGVDALRRLFDSVIEQALAEVNKLNNRRARHNDVDDALSRAMLHE